MGFCELWGLISPKIHITQNLKKKSEAIRLRQVETDTWHCLAYLTGTDLIKLSRRNSSKLFSKRSRFRCVHITRKCFDWFWSLKNSWKTLCTDQAHAYNLLSRFCWLWSLQPPKYIWVGVKPSTPSYWNRNSLKTGSNGGGDLRNFFRVYFFALTWVEDVSIDF